MSAAHALNVGAESTELFLHALIATIKMIEPINCTFTVGSERSNNKLRRGTQISCHYCCAFEPRHTLDNRGPSNDID